MFYLRELLKLVFVFIGFTIKPNSSFLVCIIFRNVLIACLLVVMYKKSSINLIKTPISSPFIVRGI